MKWCGVSFSSICDPSRTGRWRCREDRTVDGHVVDPQVVWGAFFFQARLFLNAHTVMGIVLTFLTILRTVGDAEYLHLSISHTMPYHTPVPRCTRECANVPLCMCVMYTNVPMLCTQHVCVLVHTYSAHTVVYIHTLHVRTSQHGRAGLGGYRKALDIDVQYA